MPNLYEVLGLPSGTAHEQVKAAFHRLAKGSHPDLNAGDAAAEQRFKQVNQAYQILSHPERRAAYDLGREHTRTEGCRRLRNAITATASFVMTVSCGVYFLMPHTARQVAGSHEPTEVAQNYHRPAPDSKRDSKRVETVGPTSSVPDPQAQYEQTLQSTRGRPGWEGRPDARTTDLRKSTIGEVEVHGRTAATPSSPVGGGTEAKPTLVVVPVSLRPDRRVQRERALRLHVLGMIHIQQGDVSGARMFFAQAAEAGLVPSALALAGTYDPAQLAKLKVMGMQPDIEAARRWYENARNLYAIATAERDAREDGEFLRTSAVVSGIPCD